MFAPERWHILCFDEAIGHPDKKHPMNKITRFVHVRNVRVIRKNSLVFLRCSCGFYERVGIPCVHILYLVDEMHIEMFHLRYLKVFNARYGEKTISGELPELATNLMKAQHQHVINEGNGVPVLEDIMSKICGCDDGSAEYPIL